MADSGYRHYYGQDWPPVPDGRGGFVPMSKEFAGLVIGKKWKFFRQEQGVEFDVEPWQAMLESAKSLLPDTLRVVSPWTEQHFHDWCMCPKGIVTIGAASSAKSHDTGILMVLDYVVDPYDTVILLGSTTKEALKSRSWNFVQQTYAALKRNPQGLAIPGKISKAGYALVNVSDEDAPESVGDKAGIQGRALNEDGNLQGAHGKFVRLVVDELATIKNHDVIKTAMANLRVGTLDFKFAALANPESWDDPSCKYIVPEGGSSAVNVDTGFWTSKAGYWVRHHDGYKSPALESQEAEKKYFFLMNRAAIDDNIQLCDGNTDAPRFWKMVRGFPMTVGATTPVVLDPRVAEENHASEAPVGYGAPVAVAAGIDPAWTDGGDHAVFQRVLLRVLLREPMGRMILDFGGGLHRLQISASAGKPVAQQLVEQVIPLLEDPSGYPIPLMAVAVDASANQGLADDLDIFVGQGRTSCMHVNNASRASQNPIRFWAGGSVGQGDGAHRETCRDRYQDRGTEAWCVLAEFVKAGMVRNLPEGALRALTQRRFMLLTKKQDGSEVVSGTKYPLQLESKTDFRKRFRASPDEADGCALAALAVKEVLGVLPFGWFKGASQPLVGSVFPAHRGLPPIDIPRAGVYNYELDTSKEVTASPW